MAKCKEYYKSVNNWNDLIQSNLLFMNGSEIMPQTFYYLGPLDDETTQNDTFFGELIELNKKGLFTFSSQPYNNCKITYDDYHHYQNSYVEFYVELSEIGEKLYNELVKNNHIYVSYINYDKAILLDNFPDETFNLTRQKASGMVKKFYDELEEKEGIVCKPWTDGYYYHTNWNRKIMQTLNNYLFQSSSLTEAPKIINMLEKSCKFFVASNGEYDGEHNGDSAPGIVLEIIKKILVDNNTSSYLS
jgi:hypothetical protein